MKLKKLEILGFKSFLNKARIEFPQGISAVVGPNGCGKSNIVDALRWVMGEQSVKQLRGKSMEDVIFAGASNYPPLNMAEVTLTLANDNGSAPEELREFTEIQLTRKLFRSGESAYLLNKRPCRLKDIHNVFLGSGMGAKSYAVIQQGNIGAITEAGPDERRYFIEEAAGTTRYKSRKKEALRKIKATDTNLLRVSDIIAEIKRQMGGLKRQAKKAERYKKYQARARDLDVRISIHKFDGLTADVREREELLKEMKDADVEHTAKLRKLDAAVEEIELQRERKNEEIAKQKSHKFETRRNLDKVENDLGHLREEVKRLAREAVELKASREELEKKNTDMASEIAQVEENSRALEKEKLETQAMLNKERETSREIRERAAALNEKLESQKSRLMELAAQEARYKNIYQNASTNKENLTRRLKRIDEEAAVASKKSAGLAREEREAKKRLERLRAELEDLKSRIRLMEETLSDRREKLGSQIKSVQTLELERNKARSKYTTLKKMEDSFEWYKDGVKAILKRDAAADADGRKGGGNGILGVAADILEPAPTFETAVEAVLGDSLQYILVAGQETGVEAIAYLRAEDAGRGGFIPVSSVRPMPLGGSEAPDPGKRLLSHVKVRKGGESAAEMLLGHVVVVDDLEEALGIFNDNGHMWTVVTKGGEVVTHQGILVGGSKGKLSGILEKKQEIKSLEHFIDETDARIEAERERLKMLEGEVRGFEVDLQKLMSSKSHAAQDEVEAEKELYKVSEDLKHARRHLEIVLLEQEQIQGEASDADAEMVKYNKALAEIEQEVKAAREEVEKASGEIEASSSEIEERERMVVDLRLQRTTLNARLESNGATLRRLTSFREDAVERFRQLSEDIEKKARKGAEAERRIKEYKDGLAVMYSALERLGGDLESNEADYREIDDRLRESNEAMASLRDEREKTQEKLRLLEIEQSRRKMERDNISARLEERYQAPIGELRARMNESAEDAGAPPPDRAAAAEMEEELATLKERIAKITDVNLGAIKEYEQLKDRHDFLKDQRDDLVKAIDDLQKVIRKINRITQKRFLETFELVNRKIKEVFPRLFEGGTARLVLTDPNNPLETGVEYMIHPPGKKLTRMTLLSGGEKALSAIAFIFALFLLKPTSFCILDEIDAPLDDANVFRFNNLLQLIGEKSQIVMITHNKNSMEFADTLFGITMEKKGISKVVSVNLDRGTREDSSALSPGGAEAEKE